MNLDSRNKAISQYTADARLFTTFEQSENSSVPFDYAKSVTASSEKSVPDEQVVAFLSKIQRGGFIQSFGFILAIEEITFKIIAHSENSTDYLGVNGQVESQQSKCLLGLDARKLFTESSGVSLTNAVTSSDMSLLNPVWVCSITQKEFHAVLHRIDVGILIDFEPAQLDDPAFSVAGGLQSQKFCVESISRLQSLSGGDVGVLFDTIVEEIQKLTGYDRVMVYKFHDDEHGEVVSEVRKPGLEPYLGLHYPAIDIPQASRLLFKQNRVRMIVDCLSNPVRIIQSEDLEKPLILTYSTLRSSHNCHTTFMKNMGTIASLVMTIVVNNDATDSTRLWGLVACHHCSPRYIPYLLRDACQLLMLVFGLQLNMEIRLQSLLMEKKSLRTQALLCDLLSRNAPFGVLTGSPNIMDLVKCDGSALYYDGKCHLLGVTPTEEQIKGIADWLLNYGGDAPILSTDSLSKMGYPGAALICEVVCGMASARITSKDFLFWFRSSTAREIKWAGAKHHPNDKDDGERLHPRSSFKVFLEVVKDRSLPWVVSEINSIQSVQLIMRSLLHKIKESGARTMVRAEQSNLDMGKFNSMAGEMVRLIETASVPIISVDSAGMVNGWNAKIAELTGFAISDAIGKSLVNELVHGESRTIIQSHLSRALQGEEDKNIELRLRTFGQQQKNGDAFIVANACTSKNDIGSVVGVCFIGKDVSEERLLMDKFIRLQGDYDAIVQSLNPLIPPIFASDENVCCSEWNTAMEKLTGWRKGEIIGKMLPGVIFGTFCRMTGQDAIIKFMIFLYSTLCNPNSENFPFGFFDRNGKYVEVIVTARKRTRVSGHVIGCFCFLRPALPDPQ